MVSKVGSSAQSGSPGRTPSAVRLSRPQNVVYAGTALTFPLRVKKPVLPIASNLATIFDPVDLDKPMDS